MENKKDGADLKPRMTLPQLAKYCKTIESACLHCRAIEFCGQYARWMSTHTPRVWLEKGDYVSGITFTPDSYEVGKPEGTR